MSIKEKSPRDTLLDPIDGLPIMPVGSWAFEKHKLLRDYVAISYGVRMRRKQSTLIDLYCGPGRVYDKSNLEDIRDNGVIAAYKQSMEGKSDYGKYQRVIIGDSDQDALEACTKRLEKLGANVIALHGTSIETVDEAIRNCSKYGLKLAYLDPYKPEDLPFTVLKKLATLSMMDFIIHYGQMDITRNIDAEYQKSVSRFDEFAPEWKEVINVNGIKKEQARALFFEHWLSLMQGLNLKHAKTKPLMKFDKNNAPLYRMVLFSAHPLAKQFWDSVAKSHQGSLDF